MVVENRNRPVGHRARAMAWHSSDSKAFATADAMAGDKLNTINVMAWFVKGSFDKIVNSDGGPGCQRFRKRS